MAKEKQEKSLHKLINEHESCFLTQQILKNRDTKNINKLID